MNLLSLLLPLLAGSFFAIEVVTEGVWEGVRGQAPNSGRILGPVPELPVPKLPLEVTRISFQTWRSPGMPSILVTLNQPVSRASLSRQLFFLVDGLEKLPVTLEPAGENPGLRDRQWRVQPVAEMPPDTEVRLRIKPGLFSPMGTKSGITPRTVVEFHTFPTPRFLGIECSNNSGLLIRIYTPTSQSPSQGCNPLSGISLVFSSPVTREMIRDHLVVEEFGASPKISPLFVRVWEEILGLSPMNRPRKKGEEYKILLPEGLKAATDYHLQASSSEILDEFGRPLPSDIDLSFPTNNRPPSLVLTHPISILERRVKNHIPVTLTNIAELDVKFQRLTPEGIERSQITVAVESRNLPSSLAEPSNISYRFPLRVGEWLKGQSGVLLGHLSTYPFTAPPRWFFSEVTPFHVHLKLGHDNSLVWVTDLATGKPVQGAEVQIYRDQVSAMTAKPTPLSAGVTRVDGTVFLDGADLLDPTMDNLNSWSPLYDPDRPAELFFVRVVRDQEMPSFRWPTSFRYLPKSPTMTECSQGSGCPDPSAAGAPRPKASTGPETPSGSKFMSGIRTISPWGLRQRRDITFKSSTP